MAKVVVGLSGGVDSSVAAYLAKNQGYEVIGLFMKNWHDESVTISNECPWEEDSYDALMVAQKLDIPFQTVDLSKDYHERIVKYMFDEYERGRTPNPDVLCNREIKFDVFLEFAEKLGADFVATGHYCQKSSSEIDGKTIYHLLAGADDNKDQSYFLCQINQQQLSKALFPIGHLQKSEVRKIAQQLNLVTAEKKDSQGLCFIGKVKIPDFLKQQLKEKTGDIIQVPSAFDGFRRNGDSEHQLIELSREYIFTKKSGAVVGQHQGAHFYTIGQRKGLAVGGTKEPLFVIGTDTQENIVYVAEGDQHPGLYRQGLFIANKNIHWLREDLRLSIDDEVEYSVRIRYRQPLEKAKLFMRSDGLYIIFENQQRGIAAGQFAAWYKDNELIGSGVIS